MSGVNARPANAEPEPAKKRRRKASTNGPGEDCAHCRKRGVYCDRKRPYCGACCEINKECPGYKTVLTWGVGVASRGKLRGMSLPVPVPESASSSKPSSTTAENKNRMAAAAKVKRTRAASMKSEASAAAAAAATSAASQEQPRTYSIVQEQPTTFKHETSWQLPPPLPRTSSTASIRPPSSRNGSMSKPLPPFLSHVMNPSYEDSNHQSYGSTMATSPESVRAASDYGNYAGRHMSGDSTLTDDYFPQASSYNPPYHMSTFETSATREDPMNRGAPAMQTNMMLDPRLNNAEYVLPPIAEPYYENTMDAKLSAIDPAFDNEPQRAASDTSPPDSNESSGSASNETADTDGCDMSRDNDSDSKIGYLASLQGPQVGLALYNIAPRMRSLMDYYDKYICPVVVAFDNAATPNPYRTYILNLAMNDVGLQHAIGALALNNMRMKDAGVLPNFLAATAAEDMDAIDDSLLVPVATVEENSYKAFSIAHLNKQLVSAVSARDDAVLATLLVLCLFHVSDSGFSKFKTQLAGVRKILTLRGQLMHTEFISWVEIFFAWFDAMTSAVNDREVEISGEYIDLNIVGNNLGSSEQYSGCDSRLFKLISRLGRLNLLAQEKPVTDMTARPSSQPTYVNFNNFSGGSYNMDFDGMSDDGSPTDTQADPDHRVVFWQEWRDIRQSLAQWELEHMHTPFMITPENLPLPERDLLNISECFRLAALLYTERLAHPDLPSAVDNFQGIVAQALFHIAEISEESCMVKFMLWPLFIIGTECIDDGHRESVKTRIISIYIESGFYNNLSGLRVLMRIWRDNADGTEAPPMMNGQAFRWRYAMDRLDGEYIII
jgi:hypothetical protein